MVVIDKLNSDVQPVRLDTRRLCYILECSILLVVEQQDAAIQTQSEIRIAVVVIVPSHAAVGVKCRIEPRFCCDFRELTLQIVKQCQASGRTVVSHQKIDAAGAVVIQKTSPRTKYIFSQEGLGMRALL